MKTTQLTMTSDQINKYSIRFAPEGLLDCLLKNWELGTPSCISHDAHKLFAWTIPTSILVEPQIVKLIGDVYQPESEDDSNELNAHYRIWQERKVNEHIKPYQKELDDIYDNYGEGKDVRYDYQGSVKLINENIVCRMFPNLFENEDKDGLIPYSDLNSISPGVFQIGEYLIFAHAFFRRSLSIKNSLNVPFLAILDEVKDSTEMELKIAIDRNSIGFAKTFLPTLEFDYWWGPHFSEELESIEFGVTKHKTPDQQKIFNGILGTDFWWHNQNDIKTFECEEFLDDASSGIDEDSFGCRYIHSMLNDDQKQAFHIDGAVRIYDYNGILSRIDDQNDISKSGKNTKYIKLWRIDGEIPILLWKRLLTHYYRDNHLIGEYLGGHDDKMNQKSPSEKANHQREIRPEIRMPYSIEKGSGLRFSISFHQQLQETPPEIEIIPRDSCKRIKDDFYYIENDFIEILKRAKSLGYNIDIPEGVKWLAFEDLVLNCPLVRVSGHNSVQVANDLLIAYCNSIEKWNEKNEDRLISFHFQIEYQNFYTQFSFAGHMADLKLWLNSINNQYPNTISEINEWLNNAIYNLTARRPCTFEMNKLLHNDGMLIFPRKPINKKEVKVNFDSLEISFAIEEENLPKYTKLLENRNVAIAPIFMIKATKCSKCQEAYQNCNCSKLFDGVLEEVAEAELIDFFWTERSSFKPLKRG